MLTQEWDMEKALDTRFFEGEARGIGKGVDKEKIEAVRRMLSFGLKPEEISRYADYPVDKIKLLQ